MEQQAGYWMWRKRRNDLSCHDLESSTSMPTTYCESWEEQAFAEDAGGGAGCIWPPRSYCCSFCGREFRSAQALGGHMNVHRRDRARLKQSSPTPHHDDLHQSIQNPFLPMGFQCQSDEACNPNPNSNHGGTKEKSPDHQQTCVSPFSSPILVQERAKKSQKYSWSNLAADNRYYHFSDLTDHEGDGDNSPRILQPEYVQTDLSASKQGITVGCKRKRSDHSTPTTTLPFFLKQISIETHHHIHSPSEDDIDLELRLGEPPKLQAFLIIFGFHLVAVLQLSFLKWIKIQYISSSVLCRCQDIVCKPKGTSWI